MDRYIYLLLSLSLLAIWSVIFLRVNWIRTRLLKLSIIGGFAGLVSEFWYYQDYWHPLTLMGKTPISLEDFLFGFAITGISATIYDSFNKRKKGAAHEKHKMLSLLFFIGGVISLLIFNEIFKINSIFVSAFAFLIITSIMIKMRQDLLFRSVFSGVAVLVIAIFLYTILFNLISPHYWDKYWLLSNTKFGVKVLGNIPLTEIIWYFSWGCFAGIAYKFYKGE